MSAVGGPSAAGHHGAELRRTRRELHREAHVLLAGHQLPDEVAAWLSAADLFVLASDCEGCPNVVLEALSCGVPVVVSRVGEADRIVPDGAGLLVDDPNDPSELRERILTALRRPWDGQAIRAAMEGRTWEAVAERVLEQWQRALPM